MTVSELMIRLSDYPGGMEVRLASGGRNAASHRVAGLASGDEIEGEVKACDRDFVWIAQGNCDGYAPCGVMEAAK